MIVKITCANVNKLIELEDFNYSKIAEVVKTSFKLSYDPIIEWEDEDGDRISIDCQRDLEMWKGCLKAAAPRRWWLSNPTQDPDESSRSSSPERPPISGSPPVVHPTPISTSAAYPTYRVDRPPVPPTPWVATLPTLKAPPKVEFVPRTNRMEVGAPPETILPVVVLPKPILTPKQNNVRTVALPKLNARFVKHTTCDDESSTYAPGAKFFKTWRFRNDGTLKWPTHISLLFVSKLTGDLMGGPEVLPVTFPEQIEIGKEIDITVPLVAPGVTGEYTGFWKLADETGKKFGQRVRVRIHVDEPVPDAALTKFTDHQNMVLQELLQDGWDEEGTIRLLIKANPKLKPDDIVNRLSRLGIRQNLNGI